MLSVGDGSRLLVLVLSHLCVLTVYICLRERSCSDLLINQFDFFSFALQTTDNCISSCWRTISAILYTSSFIIYRFQIIFSLFWAASTSCDFFLNLCYILYTNEAFPLAVLSSALLSLFPVSLESTSYLALFLVPALLRFLAGGADTKTATNKLRVVDGLRCPMLPGQFHAAVL